MTPLRPIAPGPTSCAVPSTRLNTPNPVASRDMSPDLPIADSSASHAESLARPVRQVRPFAKFGPDTFVVIEKWESMDDLKAHGASPHMKAYGEKNKDLVANRAVLVLQNA